MKESALLIAMFDQKRLERMIDAAEAKGIDQSLLRKMSTPNGKQMIYDWIMNPNSKMSVPHDAAIPKDEPGEFRIVHVSENEDRVVASVINDALFELFPDMISPHCYSYQKGIGTGQVVIKLSRVIRRKLKRLLGAKYDFHHYFDTVSKEAVFAIFDELERRLGFEPNTEPVINMLRRTWNDDRLFDLDGNFIEMWTGIRQGNAIAAFLADVVLYELDEFMSNKYEFYCRYSDDLIVIGDDVDEITNDINNIIAKYGVSLNPRKVQPLYKDQWFKFLGFSLRGAQISLSPGSLNTFKKEVRDRVLKGYRKGKSWKQNWKKLMKWMYVGDGRYSWATSVLRVVNTVYDLEVMNCYVMDALRASETGHRHIGGLGYDKNGKDGVVVRCPGIDEETNTYKVGKELDGYHTITEMYNALITDKDLYDTLVREMAG